MEKFIQIAIDGPAAAGKSTIAKILAKQIGFVYVDTGAMYRAITWAAINTDTDVDDEILLRSLLDKTDILLYPGGIVCVNDVDVTNEIREPLVTALVSKIAAYEAIRSELKMRQVKLAKTANVIMDGRDIGTNVLPDADYKFFMVADARIRAMRRYKENIARGIESDLDLLETEIKKRDEMDENRQHSPLKKADDAILIDTSEMSIDEVVKTMAAYVNDLT